MHTHEIINVLYKHYRQRGYLCLDELKPGTGTAGGYSGGIDFWCMHQWPSERYRRIAIEVKVSRADFRKEYAQKQTNALRHSNLLYFAAPVGIIPVWDLRSDAGLIEIRSDGTFKEVRPAPWRDADPPTLAFMASVMRRLTVLKEAAELRAPASALNQLAEA